ncbi:MAG: formyltransferase family protein, partial [Ruminococcus sp.]
MKKIIVLVSGGGTNLQALLEAEQAGGFPGGKITCVISSRGDAYALRRAEQFHVKSRVIAKKDFSDFSAYT